MKGSTNTDHFFSRKWYGLGLLLGGGDLLLVRGAPALAKSLGVSSLVIGLTEVALGTSAPELSIKLLAAFQGNTEISFGNIIGSNIANIGPIKRNIFPITWGKIRRINVEQISEIIGYGSGIAGILIVIVLAFVCYFLLKRTLLTLHKKNQITDGVFKTTKSISFWIISLLSVLFILQQIGVQVSSIISSLLAVSAMIAVGFIAVWSVLSNLLCSILLVIFRPFQLGDEIEITEPVGGSSLRGKVMKFNVMYTTLLEDIDGDKVTTNIPNNIFFQKAIRRHNCNH
jgi:small-conductance mechanosensitive channel